MFLKGIRQRKIVNQLVNREKIEDKIEGKIDRLEPCLIGD